MIHQSHFNTAILLLDAYDGSLPFHHYSKQFFAANKKYGSKDRKQIAQLCYQYFRLGHALPQLGTGDKLIQGHFLCQDAPTPFLAFFNPALNAQTGLPLAQKLALAGISANDIFPFSDALGPAVDAEGFVRSLLVQPLLFLRLRPGHEKTVPQKLSAANIPFNVAGPHCLALPNTAKADAVLALDTEAVVQDLSSQRVGEVLARYRPEMLTTQLPQVWDCCAASGGKSILLYDTWQGQCQLTVSDIRPSILYNLEERFHRAGIRSYQSFLADLSKAQPGPNGLYDAIICDAPCSGSGTWARTPEQLCFFAPEKITEYAELQKQIVANAITQLKPGGIFYYITCSVFAQENEGNVAYMQQSLGLQLLEQRLLPGWSERADSMFVAVFER
jgi:16S rRNA (cytosine967-C5)-methyltransferase